MTVKTAIAYFVGGLIGDALGVALVLFLLYLTEHGVPDRVVDRITWSVIVGCAAMLIGVVVYSVVAGGGS